MPDTNIQDSTHITQTTHANVQNEDGNQSDSNEQIDQYNRGDIKLDGPLCCGAMNCFKKILSFTKNIILSPFRLAARFISYLCSFFMSSETTTATQSTNDE